MEQVPEACGGPHGGPGGQAVKEAEACGDHMLEQCFPEGLQPVEGTHTGSGERCDGLLWTY